MVDFIVKYWVQELFVLIIAGMTAMWKKMSLKKTEYSLLKAGMLALLHDRLYESCSFYIKQGWCGLNDRHNLECMYKPYKALGGNGTGENLYTRCLELPIEPPSYYEHECVTRVSSDTVVSSFSKEKKEV